MKWTLSKLTETYPKPPGQEGYRMNPQTKKAWLKALRSGDYRQGKVNLFNDGKYCCLGVLGRVQRCPTVRLKSAGLLFGVTIESWYFSQHLHLLPEDIQSLLAKMNDAGRTFKQIAMWIEKHL